MYSRSEVKNAY